MTGMEHRIIAIDQSTSGTKVMLFDEQLRMLKRVNKAHQQYYPQPGWVEHDAEEIYNNVVEGVRELLADEPADKYEYSMAITNQRETVVVWNRHTGKPIAHAVVWQCLRGAAYCNQLKAEGWQEMVQERSGLLIDPYFSASGVHWLLHHVEGASSEADAGNLLMGTIDSWLVWKLTGGKHHLTDVTNASRTLLLNIRTLQWDEELLKLFDIPASMMPQVLPCDASFGETTVEGVLPQPIKIAGVLGDSHGALAGQMCFAEGYGKATYGTGSSVMVNVGENFCKAPEGLVTSVAFAAKGHTYYGFEGNIHCTGATLKWMADQLQLIGSPAEVEQEALRVTDTGGVYLVPAFAGLGAPWWNTEARAALVGMSLSTTRAHVLRAALESICYQVNDLVTAMTERAGVSLKELRVDGGPTKNQTLMQMQSDMLGVSVNCSDVEEASALGAVVMNVLARGMYASFSEVAQHRKSRQAFHSAMPREQVAQMVAGWHRAVNGVIQMTNQQA